MSNLDSCISYLFIPIYHSKFRNFLQGVYFEFSHELLLHIGICYIFLVDLFCLFCVLEWIYRLTRLSIFRLTDTQIATHRLVNFQLRNCTYFDLQFSVSHVRDSEIPGSCECSSCLASFWTTEDFRNEEFSRKSLKCFEMMVATQPVIHKINFENQKFDFGRTRNYLWQWDYRLDFWRSCDWKRKSDASGESLCINPIKTII